VGLAKLCGAALGAADGNKEDPAAPRNRLLLPKAAFIAGLGAKRLGEG